MHNTAIRISDRQYGQLRYMASLDRPANLDELSTMNQLTVGANKRRGWLAETPDRHAVRLTREGREALSQFENGDFFRTVARMKFSSFLDIKVYDDAKGDGDGGKKGKAEVRGGRPPKKSKAGASVKRRSEAGGSAIRLVGGKGLSRASGA